MLFAAGAGGDSGSVVVMVVADGWWPWVVMMVSVVLVDIQTPFLYIYTR